MSEPARALDEVIKVMDHVQFCCTNCKLQFDCDETECFLEDALHYLKAYRSDQLEWEANRKAWNLVEEDLISARMKYIAKLKELGIGTLNDPLTWNELRQMCGKPVWVEVLRDNGRRYKWEGQWMLVKEFSQGALGEYCHMEPNYRTWINTTYGDLWQAYRKERG